MRRIAVTLGLVLVWAACGRAPQPGSDTATATDTAGGSPVAPGADTELSAWLFGADTSADLLRRDDTEESLRQRFGDALVRRDSIYVGEGMYQEGLVLFPDEAGRRLELVFTPQGTIENARAREESGAVWTIHPGVRVGTTLEELEQFNGGPFELLGFGWDYGGTSGGWLGGRLGDAWGEHVLLRLRPSVERPEAERQVLGDRRYRSDHPAMRELRPVVYELFVRPR